MTSPSKKSRTWLITAGVVLVLAAAAYGGYVVLSKRNDAAATTRLRTTTIHKNQADSQNGQISSATKHYISTSFMLEFDYPSDWTVTDTANSGQLTVRSPAMKLKNLEGKTFTGQVLFMIRDKQQPLPEFDKGNAVAARESLKINYAKPSAVQRGSTYLSFLRYAGMQRGTLEGVYVTGNVGYQYAQAIPKVDFTPIDPVISVAFQECPSTGCSTEKNVPAGIAPTMWNDKSFSTPLTKLFESLIVS